MARSPASVDDLRRRQRVHVKRAAICAAAVVLVLTPGAVLVYRVAADAELEGLRARIHRVTVGVAAAIDGDRPRGIFCEDDPYRRELLSVAAPRPAAPATRPCPRPRPWGRSWTRRPR